MSIHKFKHIHLAYYGTKRTSKLTYYITGRNVSWLRVSLNRTKWIEVKLDLQYFFFCLDDQA